MRPDYQTPERMAAKRAAIPLPDLTGKSVLDVGTDFGEWVFLAEKRGASKVLGLDRNRAVRGRGVVDLVRENRERAELNGSECEFAQVNLGKQWHEFGKFDVIFVFSMYHHWFENCRDHLAIWFWLRRHLSEGGEILWEGPVDDSDPVVRANVSDRKNFTRAHIMNAAAAWFEAEKIGPALHEPTREVWRFRHSGPETFSYTGTIQSGAGGASKAFEYANGRRIEEIAHILGVKPVPGSLNVLTAGFHWDFGYFRSEVLDVVQRGKGLDVEWAPRWARFYPITVNEIPAFAFRFEGERYDNGFVEIISDRRLRDHIQGEKVRICR